MITEDHKKSLDALLKKCLDHDDLLSEWENDYVSDFVDKLEKYGEQLNISEKQNAIFERIEKKLEDAGI
jgi:ribosome assembly protein YihI (activator of Der GTPase)